MRVAVLGAGSIGFGTAAFLCDTGHDPILWSPSGERTKALAAGEKLVATGQVTGSFRPRVAGSAAEAVAGAEAVVLTVPGYGHRAVFDAVAPHLQAGVPFVVSSHCSLGALYLSKKLAERGVALPIVAWGTTVPTGRQRGLTEVNVNNIRKKVDFATLPVAAADQGGAVSTAIFGDRFVRRDDVLAISLSNLNPQNHMGIALCNLTRMEKAETWGQSDCITEKVGRLLESLDAERLAIAGVLGYPVRTIFEHYQLSFGAPAGTVAEMSAFLAARDKASSSGYGPTTADSRYVTEDVPFGLYPSTLLGQLVGKPARLHEAGIDIFNALYGRDFRAENDLLPALGVQAMSVDALRRVARDGWGR